MTQETAIASLDDLGQDWLEGAGLSPCGVENLIKRIYIEIGTCDFCKYSKIIMEGTPMAYRVCERGCFDPIEDEFYCADFEEGDGWDGLVTQNVQDADKSLL